MRTNFSHSYRGNASHHHGSSDSGGSKGVRTRADDAASLPDAGQGAQVNVPALLLALGPDDVVALRVAAHLRHAQSKTERGR